MQTIQVIRIAQKWAAIKPQLIAQEGSARHIQSVLEEMQTQIATLCKTLGVLTVTNEINEPASFTDPLAEWVGKQTGPFTMAQAAEEALGLLATELTRNHVTRLGIELQKLDCTRATPDATTGEETKGRFYCPPVDPAPHFDHVAVGDKGCVRHRLGESVAAVIKEVSPDTVKAKFGKLDNSGNFIPGDSFVLEFFRATGKPVGGGNYRLYLNSEV